MTIIAANSSWSMNFKKRFKIQIQQTRFIFLVRFRFSYFTKFGYEDIRRSLYQILRKILRTWLFSIWSLDFSNILVPRFHLGKSRNMWCKPSEDAYSVENLDNFPKNMLQNSQFSLIHYWLKSFLWTDSPADSRAAEHIRF